MSYGGDLGGGCWKCTWVCVVVCIYCLDLRLWPILKSRFLILLIYGSLLPLHLLSFFFFVYFPRLHTVLRPSFMPFLLPLFHPLGHLRTHSCSFVLPHTAITIVFVVGVTVDHSTGYGLPACTGADEMPRAGSGRLAADEDVAGSVADGAGFAVS